MKTVTVYFSEPVTYTVFDERRVIENGKYVWKEVELSETKNTCTFSSIAPAKKLIKANLDKYVSSCITKFWSNGDWENLGEIKLKGSNKHFIANTRQKVANY